MFYFNYFNVICKRSTLYAYIKPAQNWLPGCYNITLHNHQGNTYFFIVLLQEIKKDTKNLGLEHIDHHLSIWSGMLRAH